VREGLARLLSNTNYRPIVRLATFEELAKGSAQAARALFIISRDAFTRPVHDTPLVELQLLKQRWPDARAIVLSDAFDADDAVAALRAGANGYILNTTTSDALIKSLDLVMMGETVLASEFSRAVYDTRSKLLELAAPVARSAPAVHVLEEADGHELTGRNGGSRELSSRETAILTRLMRGDSNKNIARRIGVAEATVKTHIKAILRKIRVKNRTQAALWAVANMAALADAKPPPEANGAMPHEESV
jgi:two-component system nitrate/nitrite response regulator NarL